MASAFLAYQVWAKSLEEARGIFLDVAARHDERYCFAHEHGATIECVASGKAETQYTEDRKRQYLAFFVFENDVDAVAFRLAFGDETEDTFDVWKGMRGEWNNAKQARS